MRKTQVDRMNKIKKIKEESKKQDLAYKLAVEIENEIYSINNVEGLKAFLDKYRDTKYEWMLGGL